jgi:pimeloyl-ACP methyl ester carboxylesterase
MEPFFAPEHAFDRAASMGEQIANQLQLMSLALSRHMERCSRDHNLQASKWFEGARTAWHSLQEEAAQGRGFELFTGYAQDAAQRTALTLDVLRERGNIDIEHEAAGTPPVLVYDYEVVIDGATMKHPVNYRLLRIIPPQGTVVNDQSRPFVIIDPRAGHGAGIGGFKEDSQVGVALRAGHAVYFVAFGPHPQPGQTLTDVTWAEAEFVREVARRHPNAPNPIVIGNCQGGWATLLLAATNPDITGPLVINGAPLAYWSGPLGSDPMRYNGGLFGGIVPALLFSDLGHGEFDGAHLVMNFELLNPSRNYWGKYFDLYQDPEGGRERFLEFERWWGGFHFMNEAEIRWIIEQLFVGNRLARGEAYLEHGRQVDLKSIRSPVIVFASFGDNITPPQQALNWVQDTYADEEEIKVRGQRIIYLVHAKVGHLGIFVSSSVARKEHTEMTSTLQTIEALAPGLYEMRIEQQEGHGANARFLVSFHSRTMRDLAEIDCHRRGEQGFGTVDRLSQLGSNIYDLTWRPLVQAVVSPAVAAAVRASHPLRVQRTMLSDRNPFMRSIAAVASNAREHRVPIAADHPLRQMEKLWSSAIEQSIDLFRDLRDAYYETAFLGLYMSPYSAYVGRDYSYERTRKDPNELRFLPEVQAHLLSIDQGGYAEAIIRMLIVLAAARGSVRRDRLERSERMLTHDEPFASMGAAKRAAIIHQQTVIIEFERERAIEALTKLIVDPESRRKAVAAVEEIAGPPEEMEPHTIQAIQTFRRLFDLSPMVVAAE